MSTPQRLLDAFVPEHYDIFLDIDRETKRFSGAVHITGTANTSTFALNQRYLTITSVKQDGKPCTYTSSDDTQTITIEGHTTGSTQIDVAFTAALTDMMMGIYPSYYTHDGVKKQLVSTQFETTFAREAFPCVDEPSAKATFTLSIRFDEKPGETVISNQPEVSCTNGIHTFKQTVRMSTYLLAFALGELQSKFARTASGVEIGVFSTKAHQPKELDFALDIATRCIDFYEDFYHTPYPLEHSYQIALPDFSAGAMENWGLVTYREAYMLIDPDNSSLPNKQRVANVIAHELAHQWFGDLVTMKWWDNLWLNESFANMMEYVAIDALEPTWKIWEAFQASEPPLALARDATDGVQSVHVMVEDPAEIDAIFDSAIVYAKGARLLVMVRALVGDEALRNGLKSYFEAHGYGNAEGADLWHALEQASGFNVGAIMETWLEQPGYPVISVRLEKDTVQIEQQQFFIGEHTDKQRLWQIPLASNWDVVPAIMSEKHCTINSYKETRAQAGAPLRLNVGNNTHAVIHYDDALLSDIAQHIDTLSHIDQLQLLQDMQLLAKAGKVSLAACMPLARTLARSSSYIVQRSIHELVRTLDSFVESGSAQEQQLQAYARELAHESVARLGVSPREGEPVDDALTRPCALAMALYGQDKDTICALHDMYVDHKTELLQLCADVRALVLKNEVQHYGNDELFGTLMDAYQHTADAHFKSDVCAAVCASKNTAHIESILKAFICADIIKPQDLRLWYALLLDNDDAQQLAWNWLRTNWQWLEATVGGDMEFTMFIEATARAFHTHERLAEFTEFFEPKRPQPGLGREIDMDITLIAGKAAFIDANKDAVFAALDAYGK